MRVLFSGVPAPGHLVPMLPLARAARRAGHDAFLAVGSTAPLLAGFPVVAAGAGGPTVLAESVPAPTAEVVARVAPACGCRPPTG